jgi:hypothetical protein
MLIIARGLKSKAKQQLYNINDVMLCDHFLPLEDTSVLAAGLWCSQVLSLIMTKWFPDELQVWHLLLCSWCIRAPSPPRRSCCCWRVLWQQDGAAWWPSTAPNAPRA